MVDILVKVSGSLIKDDKFYDWLLTIADEFNELFVLCGGGEFITEILKKEGIPYEFGPQGREIKSARGKRLAKQALEEEKILVEKKLWKRGIDATVFIPTWEVGDKTCQINGDSLAVALYPNFDKIFIVTLIGRTKSFPENLSKIEVVYL